jgi:RimJ/RimL family protein N-acetyltransferase
MALVRLRALTASDGHVISREFLDPGAATEANWFGYWPGRAKRRQERIESGEIIDDRGGALAVVATDGSLVGEVSWHLTDNSTPPNGECWNIGIFILPDARRRGYGAAAQRAVAEYLFAHTPCARVEASTEAGNLAEKAALRKAGFTQEGVLRKAVFRGGAYRDMVMFSILREEL